MRPLVSIIVPVYNAKDSLSQCIESILCQSFTNFELILIDDGSTDESKNICDNYALKDTRIVTFHKLNGGVSSARNKGLDLAQGVFITFIDSDDYVCESFIESLLVSEDADFIIGGYISIEAKGEKAPFSFGFNYLVDALSIGSFLQKNLSSFILRVPWAKLFKRKMIEKFNIRFDEHLYFGEDTIFIQTYLLHVESIICVKDTYYMYNRPLKWYSKYSKNIQAQLESFNAIARTLEQLTSIYDLPMDKQLDKFVYVFTIVFQNYMFNTPFNRIDKNIIYLFFNNRSVQTSLVRLKHTYKNMIPLSFLVEKKWYALLIYYSKFYFKVKR